MSQSAGDFARARRATGSGTRRVLRALSTVFSGSFSAAVMYSRSFARVIATYSSRSSSESVSRSSRRRIALRARVGYSTRRSVSVYFGPRPSCGCMSTAALPSRKLNCRAVSHRKTTGNSRPFDLCTDRICTAAAPSEASAGSCPRSAMRRSQSTKRCRPR